MLKHLAALCLLASPALAQQPQSTPALNAQAVKAGDDPTVRMQTLVTQAVTNEHFTGSVLVVKDGAILVDQGYASADLEWKIPNSPATRFRLGSLTKQFTAACILLLEERGKLSLNDRISKYMPDAPPAWKDITLFHLLTHTSGIPNFTSFPDYRTTEWRDTNPTELVARFRDKPLEFTPGSRFNYSNSGYVLLGYLLEKMTGGTYGAFLQANIFTPLGMADTGLDSNTAIIPNRAQGYTFGPRGFEHAGYTSMTIPFSAGALYSTTGDLLKWQNALFTGKLLQPASLLKMTTPYKDDYALGVATGHLAGHPFVTHNGGIEGFVTTLTRYPADDLTVVVLANSDSANPDALAGKLGRLALGLPLVAAAVPHAEVTLDSAALALYPGTYRLAPTFAITISLAGTQLYAQATNQQAFPIYPESRTKFFYKAVDAQLEFTLNPVSHQPTSLTLHQNGRNIEGPRE